MIKSQNKFPVISVGEIVSDNVINPAVGQENVRCLDREDWEKMICAWHRAFNSGSHISEVETDDDEKEGSYTEEYRLPIRVIDEFRFIIQR